MTQSFTVVETQTAKKGVYVSVKDTVADVRAILDGKVDALKPEDFMFIGTLKDVEQKLDTVRKEKAAKEASKISPNNAISAPQATSSDGKIPPSPTPSSTPPPSNQQATTPSQTETKTPADNTPSKTSEASTSPNGV